MANGTNASNATSFVTSIDAKKGRATSTNESVRRPFVFSISKCAHRENNPALLSPSTAAMRQKRSASTRRSIAAKKSCPAGTKRHEAAAQRNAMQGMGSERARMRLIFLKGNPTCAKYIPCSRLRSFCAVRGSALSFRSYLYINATRRLRLREGRANHVEEVHVRLFSCVCLRMDGWSCGCASIYERKETKKIPNVKKKELVTTWQNGIFRRENATVNRMISEFFQKSR